MWNKRTRKAQRNQEERTKIQREEKHPLEQTHRKIHRKAKGEQGELAFHKKEKRRIKGEKP